MGPHVGFVSEFIESHSAIPVSIHFINHILHVFVPHEVASGLYHPLKLVGTDRALVIEIEGVESFIEIESRSRSQSLSQVLVGIFHSKVSAPHGLELEGSVWQENVVSSDDSGNVVGTSSVHHT